MEEGEYPIVAVVKFLDSLGCTCLVYNSTVFLFFYFQSWTDMCSYACKVALNKAKLKGSSLSGYFSDEEIGDEDCTFDYTTGNLDIDRVMTAIGWESAFTSPPPNDTSDNCAVSMFFS